MSRERAEAAAQAIEARAVAKGRLMLKTMTVADVEHYLTQVVIVATATRAGAL